MPNHLTRFDDPFSAYANHKTHFNRSGLLKTQPAIIDIIFSKENSNLLLLIIHC